MNFQSYQACRSVWILFCIFLGSVHLCSGLLHGSCIVWKAVVDVPCNLQRVVIISLRVVDINQ